MNEDRRRLDRNRGLSTIAAHVVLLFVLVLSGGHASGAELRQSLDSAEYQVLAQTGGASNTLTRQGDVIYLGHGQKVLAVDVSASELTGGRIIAVSPILPGFVQSVVARDDWLYAALTAGIPKTPTSSIAVLRLDRAGLLPLEHLAPSDQLIDELALDGPWLMAAGHQTVDEIIQGYHEGIEAWDLSDPSRPEALGWYDQHIHGALADVPTFVAIRSKGGHNYLLLNDNESRGVLRQFRSGPDVGQAPVETVQFRGRAYGIAIDHDLLAVLSSSSGFSGGALELSIFDRSDSRQLRRIGGRSLGSVACSEERWLQVDASRDELLIADPCDDQLRLYTDLRAAEPSLVATQRTELDVGGMLRDEESIYLARGALGGLQRRSLAALEATWTLDLLGAVDRLASDGTRVWTAHPLDAVERRSLVGLDGAWDAEATWPRSRAAAIDLSLHQGLLVVADGTSLRTLDVDSLETGSSTSIGGPIVQVESDGDSVFVSAGEGGWARFTIDEGQWTERASNAALFAGPFDLAGDLLVGLARPERYGDTRIYDLDAETLTQARQSGPLVAEISRDPPGTAALAAMGDDVLVATGCPSGWCSGDSSKIQRFRRNPDADLTERAERTLRDTVGRQPTVLLSSGGDELLVGADQGLAIIASDLPNPISPSAMWRSGIGLRDAQILEQGDRWPDEILVALGEAGLVHLGRVGLHQATPTPTEVPATPTGSHTAVTPPPSPSRTPTSVDPAGLAHRVYLPLLGSPLPKDEPPGGGRWHEAYVGAPTLSLATDGRYIYRDEGGQLVVLEIGEEGRVFEIGRGPSLGAMYRDLILVKPILGLDIAIVALLDGPVVILDVSDPARIVEITRWESVTAESMVLDGDRLYTSAGDRIEVFPIRAPDYPAAVEWSLQLAAEIGSIHVHEGRIYAIERIFSDNLHILDPRAEDGAALTNSIQLMEEVALDLHFEKDWLVVDSGYSILTYDLSDPDLPEFRGMVFPDGDDGFIPPRHVIDGEIIYSVSNMESSIPGLSVYNFEHFDPERGEPVLEPLGRVGLEGRIPGILIPPVLVGDRLVVQYGSQDAHIRMHSDLVVYDVAKPSAPRLVARSTPTEGSIGLFVDADLALMHAGILPDDRLGLRRVDALAPVHRIDDSIDFGPDGWPIQVDGSRLISRSSRTGGRHVLGLHTLEAWPSPNLLGFVETEHRIEAAALDGDRIYASLTEQHSDHLSFALLAVDIEPDGGLVDLGEMPIAGRWPIHTEEGRVYIVNEAGDLAIVDVRDPAVVDILAEVAGCSQDFAVRDAHLYCLNAAGIRIFDLGDPANPVQRSALDLPRLQHQDFRGGSTEIVVAERTLYILSRGVLAVDVSDLDRPRLLGELAVPAFMLDEPEFVLESAVALGDHVAAILRRADGIAVFGWEE